MRLMMGYTVYMHIFPNGKKYIVRRKSWDS